jgi:hypothetical protein
MHFYTGWGEGFLSRREFGRLYNPWSELHGLIFADHFWHARYHSTHNFHHICFTQTVNKYSNRYPGYKQW